MLSSKSKIKRKAGLLLWASIHLNLLLWAELLSTDPLHPLQFIDRNANTQHLRMLTMLVMGPSRGVQLEVCESSPNPNLTSFLRRGDLNTQKHEGNQAEGKDPMWTQHKASPQWSREGGLRGNQPGQNHDLTIGSAIQSLIFCCRDQSRLIHTCGHFNNPLQYILSSQSRLVQVLQDGGKGDEECGLV